MSEQDPKQGVVILEVGSSNAVNNLKAKIQDKELSLGGRIIQCN
jgi:hypothetical protein